MRVERQEPLAFSGGKSPRDACDRMLDRPPAACLFAEDYNSAPTAKRTLIVR
jgi:hypothetical protein